MHSYGAHTESVLLLRAVMCNKIEIVMFDYHDWEFAQLFFLKGKDLAGTLTESQPEDPIEAKAWRKTDQQAYANWERVNLVCHKQLRKVEMAKELLDAIKWTVYITNRYTRCRRLKRTLQQGLHHLLPM
ncbi:hypothetical protein HDU77_008628 [Chytriomyces hyalinus]|nr:hypothetical protein HDU77_008628 [Chytriomyces hyalinus]